MLFVCLFAFWPQKGLQRNATGISSLSSLQTLYIDTIRQAVSGSLFDEAGRCGPLPGCLANDTVPYNGTLREGGEDWPFVGHTMTGHKRLRNVEEVIRTVINEGVPGHFAELGVWRGGSCIFAKAILRALGEDRDRDVLVFDAFQSFGGYGGNDVYLAVSLEAVQHNFDKYGLLDENVRFYKGLFKDSVPRFRKLHGDETISVLRIDGNFYDSYQDAFYYLYELVPVGGFVIFDDIRSHPAVMQMWLDFQADQHVTEELTTIDIHSAYFRKKRDVKVDMGKMRPPRDANKPPAR